MEFIGLQMTFTVVVILTAAAWVIFFDQRKKQRQQQEQQRVRAHSQSVARAPRPVRMFNAVPFEFAPARKVAAERPLEPLVGTATPSRPAVQPRIERETVTVQMAPPSPPAPSSTSEALAPTAAPSDYTLPAFTIDAVLWERLISSHPKHHLLAAEGVSESIEKTPARPMLGSASTVEASYQMIQENDLEAPSTLLSGMIQQPALDELLESEKSFTGLVVSIGINESDSGMWHSQGLMQSVGSYIAGLLREKDFACRTAYDEFIIVCREEQGAQAQRRLNHISERLWDYQLRGIGACSIMFSWGGLEVKDQPLTEALASATERMRETKRTCSSAIARRQAV